jgi:hypothetical protein
MPDSLWDGALATMRAYATLGSSALGELGSSALGERGSEALVYLGGVVAGEGMVVAGLHRCASSSSTVMDRPSRGGPGGGGCRRVAQPSGSRDS